MSKELKKNDVHALHTELEHPSEEITTAMGKEMGLKFIGMFEPCCSGMGSKVWLRKVAVPYCSSISVLLIPMAKLDKRQEKKHF